MDNDEAITAVLEDETAGSWHTEGEGDQELQVYTPNPSAFTRVTPLALLNAFLDAPEEDRVRLNLP